MSETNYGVIADRLAWEMPLNATATIELPPFQIFNTTAPEESEHALRVRPLARSTALSLYVRAFDDGGGEDGLHAHADDAIWLVLEGRASFFGENGRALGDARPARGHPRAGSRELPVPLHGQEPHRPLRRRSGLTRSRRRQRMLHGARHRPGSER